jgi:AcrR family transcriptional regulator
MSSTSDDARDAGEVPSLIDLLPRRKPRRSRARQAALSREQIVKAAVALADAEGADAISMRRIAADLGVGAMTLYGYVADREALIGHMINQVSIEGGRPGRPSGIWRADLELVARRFRAVCLRHPWLPAVLGTRPFLLSPTLLGWAEFVLATLEPHGLDLPTAAAALRLVNNYVLGTTLRDASDAQAASTEQSPVYQAAVASYLQQLSATGRYPHMSRMTQIIAEGRDLSPDQSFDVGLQCLLDGIGTLIAQTSAS